LVRAKIDISNYPYGKCVLFEPIKDPDFLGSPHSLHYLASIGAKRVIWEDGMAFAVIETYYTEKSPGPLLPPP
jgi:hypothetical protein